MLRLIEQSGNDNRVFQIKLFQLMQDLKKQQPFGKIIACKFKLQHTNRIHQLLIQALTFCLKNK